MTELDRATIIEALTPALRRRIDRRILTPITVALGAVTILVGAVEIFGQRIPEAVQLVPFAVSILVFGLPHGALDHLVPARLLSGIDQRRSIALVTCLYLVVGGATLALWLWLPIVGFAFFIAMTWFHWGQGDLYIDHALGDGPTSRADAATTVALRGALPMLLPLAAHPLDYATVISRTVHTLAPAVTVDTSVITGPAVRITAAALVLLLAIAQLLLRHRGRRAVQSRSVQRQVVETAVLIAFFAVVPPLLAVGLYFTLWHSIRHILRLELLDPASAALLDRGRLIAPLLRFFRQAWPITLIAVAMLATFALVLQSVDLGVYLILISALTTPHAIVVTWMDRRQQTWRATAATSALRSLPDRE